MSSSICKSFESNAWRSDLCSHCFQSKEEHGQVREAVGGQLGTRYQSVLNHTRSSYRATNSVSSSVTSPVKPTMAMTSTSPIVIPQPSDSVNSILKRSKTVKTNKAVKFPDDDNEAKQIIGYGGQESFEPDEDDIDSRQTGSDEDDDDLPFTEEERQLHNQTQKNTSFNSVSRNLLAAEVATFVSHGGLPSGDRSANSNGPLVTIRAFGEQQPKKKTTESAASCPKVNLVSPMRNGQVLQGTSAFRLVSAAEEMKNRENLLIQERKTAPVAKEPVKVEEKITSFTDPMPAEKSVSVTIIRPDEIKNTQPALSVTQSVLLSSKMASGKVPDENDANGANSGVGGGSVNNKLHPLGSAVASSGSSSTTSGNSNRITLSRKPPVWREKPRIPIKPQSMVPTEPLPVIRPVPSALHSSIMTRGSSLMKAQPSESNLLGQMSVRFVHLGQSEPTFTDDTPPLVPVADRELVDTVDVPRPAEEPETEIQPNELTETLTTAETVAQVTDEPTVEIDNSPPEAAAQETIDVVVNSVAHSAPSSEPRSNSTRGLTRSAFEALRANLAGSLELTRMYQPSPPQRSHLTSSTKRQAPPTPLTIAPSPVVSAAPAVEPEMANAPPDIHTPPDIPAPPAPAEESTDTETVKSVPERATSVSPQFRNSSVCIPHISALDEDNHPRSISMSRVERTESQHQTVKPPSLRKIIKERATQLLHMAEGGARITSSGGPRLSRSERFAAEGYSGGDKKPKSRFSSIRKLLGFKKGESGDALGGAVEPLSPKIRPEIVHPIDFNPTGQVQVVTGKLAREAFADPVLDTVVLQAVSQSGDGNNSGTGDYSSVVTGIRRSDSSLSSQGSSPFSSLQSVSFKSSSSAGRPRPPPPPRVNSVDPSTPSRPIRPPPPKSSEAHLAAQKFSAPSSSSPSHSQHDPAEYANLGDIRNGIMPKKPERTASLRTRERSTAADSTTKQDGLHYDCVTIGKPNADEDGYIIPMRIKSTPSFSSGSSSASAGSAQRHSLSTFQQPQSGGSDGAGSWTPLRREGRPPSLRQSRLDLHVKLEDHYGTVTGANFQALAQLLEQATSKRPLSQHFHELRRTKELKWSAFGGRHDHDVVLLRTECLTVLQSSWQEHELLISVYPRILHDTCIESKAPFAQPSVVNFVDRVPTPFQSPMTAGDQSGLEIFPPGQVATLKELAHVLASELRPGHERLQQGLCVVLQVCRALEWLRGFQQGGHSRINYDDIVFYRENSQDAYRLFWLGNGGQKETADHSINATTKETLSGTIRLMAPLLGVPIVDKLSSFMLQRDGLVKMCSYLEMAMFGPGGDLSDAGDAEPLDTYQRWLDVERASVLNELIRTQGLWRVKLSVLDEFRLSFLVSTSPHNLLDTSQI